MNQRQQTFLGPDTSHPAMMQARRTLMTEQEERSHHKIRLQPTETLTKVWSTETKPFSPPWVKFSET